VFEEYPVDRIGYKGTRGDARTAERIAKDIEFNSLEEWAYSSNITIKVPPRIESNFLIVISGVIFPLLNGHQRVNTDDVLSDPSVLDAWSQ